MQYRELGATGLRVSAICLGTMTFGEQNTEPEAHRQLDVATESGINFIDTAEMYPVPPKAQTQGLTETIIGNWLRRRGRRDDLVIASKVSGRSTHMDWLREGELCLDRRNIEYAIDASLKRLQTDYVDLYQVHWPDRETNYFGRLGYRHSDTTRSIPIEETLGVLQELVTAGKVRHVGVSNETPWGVMNYVRGAREKGWPAIVSVQNPYNLLNRTFEIGLAEIAHRENIGLLAYSPLAFGVLSGKYLKGARPEGSRLQRFARFNRYTNDQGQSATARYVRLAHDHGLDPAQMALAFVNMQPFVTASIIGATTLGQLETDIASIDLTLTSDILDRIESIHRRQPNPCP